MVFVAEVTTPVTKLKATVPRLVAPSWSWSVAVTVPPHASAGSARNVNDRAAVAPFAIAP
jgi:hypothetical protein